MFSLDVGLLKADIWDLESGLSPFTNFLGFHIYKGILGALILFGAGSGKIRLPPFLATPTFPGQTLIENLAKKYIFENLLFAYFFTISLKIREFFLGGCHALFWGATPRLVSNKKNEFFLVR